MRIYINQKEREFLINIFFEYIENNLAESQCNENSEYDDSIEINLINSLFKKLNPKTKRTQVKIKYTYEKL